MGVRGVEDTKHTGLGRGCASAEGLGWALPGAETDHLGHGSILETEASSGGKQSRLK